jgi:ribonuclease HI
VIAMDGACRSNSTAHSAKAVSSLGVFCGFANPYNRVQRLTDEDVSGRHTSQLAQLKACARALCQAGLIGEDRAVGPADGHSHGRDVRLVVIKSDSEYIIRGVTELMPRWKANGWRNSRGVEVANAEEWRTIDRLVYSLRGDGIEVRFWLVPKGMNRQASGMARSALVLG